MCWAWPGYVLVWTWFRLGIGWTGHGLGWAWADLGICWVGHVLDWPWYVPGMAWAFWACAGLVMRLNGHGLGMKLP